MSGTPEAEVPPSLDELIAAHAAGTLPSAVAMAVATHLALSPASRRLYRAYEEAGGTLLEGIRPVDLGADSWARMAAMLDDGAPDGDGGDPAAPPRREPLAALHPSVAHLPRPLRDHLPRSLEDLAWRRFGGTTLSDLDLGVSDYRVSLINVRAGRAFPRHTHAGTELILVLDGGFRDESGHYVRGDLQIADPSVEHQPVADPGRDWLWLRVLDAKLTPTGRVGRLLGPSLEL